MHKWFETCVISTSFASCIVNMTPVCVAVQLSRVCWILSLLYLNLVLRLMRLALWRHTWSEKWLNSCMSLGAYSHITGTVPTSVVNSQVKALNVCTSLHAVMQGTRLGFFMKTLWIIGEINFPYLAGSKMCSVVDTAKRVRATFVSLTDPEVDKQTNCQANSIREILSVQSTLMSQLCHGLKSPFNLYVCLLIRDWSGWKIWNR